VIDVTQDLNTQLVAHIAVAGSEPHEGFRIPLRWHNTKDKTSVAFDLRHVYERLKPPKGQNMNVYLLGIAAVQEPSNLSYVPLVIGWTQGWHPLCIWI